MRVTLRDFGSYTAGGRVYSVSEGTPFQVQLTRDSSILYDPRGHFPVEHAYVQYFIPEPRNTAPPMVLVHGGGMHGATWETTPDGRPGWLNLLLARGYEVHVVDAMERGRAGWVPGLWEGTPILRSMEEAWTLFRFGPAEGFTARHAFPQQQFPVDKLEGFARSFVPRWLTTTGLQVGALVAVLERTGPAVLVTHSQGGEIGFDAQGRRPDLVAGIIAVEPSAAPSVVEAETACPLTLLAGDFLDVDEAIAARHRLWQDIARRWLVCTPQVEMIWTAEAVRPGGSHMLMMDRHSEACLEAALDSLMTHIG